MVMIMKYNLDNIIAKRKNKIIYKDRDKVIKLFVEDYSKSNILNEALNHARVEEGTNLNIPKLNEVTMIDNHWALINDYIEGMTLEELMAKYPEKENDFLELFVNIQLEILENKVPLLNRIKDKFRRKLTESPLLNETTRYELLQRLEGMQNHNKLCHGDFNPSNIIVKETGEYYIIDWAHVTQGNASADAARTFLLFSMHGKESLAQRYLELFSKVSKIPIQNIQRWIPIVAATQLTKGNEDEYEFLSKWIDIVDYE